MPASYWLRGDSGRAGRLKSLRTVPLFYFYKNFFGNFSVAFSSTQRAAEGLPSLLSTIFLRRKKNPEKNPDFLYRHKKTDQLPADQFFFESARRDSNPRPSPWQGDTPPLSHSRVFLFLILSATTYTLPHFPKTVNCFSCIFSRTKNGRQRKRQQPQLPSFWRRYFSNGV